MLPQAIVAHQGRFTLSDDSHGPLTVGLHYDKTFEYMRDRDLAALHCLAEDVQTDRGPPVVVPVLVEGKPWLDVWRASISMLEK